MKTVGDMYTYEFEEKKSKFIGICFYIDSEEYFFSKLDEIKNKYPKATHYVYAYRLIDTGRLNDDGEPSGTGALPIQNILEKEDLYMIGFVVVRYFGGIKLGAGGLIRAYSKACSNLINNDRLKDLVSAKIIDIKLEYNDIKDIDYLINKSNSKLLNKEFSNDITYTIEVSDSNIELFNKYDYKVIKNTMIVS